MTTKKKKRPYQPPRVKTSDVFERLALACSGLGSEHHAIKGAPHCSQAAVS